MKKHWFFAIFACALFVAVPHATGALTSYDDPIDDAAGAPDFWAGELVTNDDNTVTIATRVHNRVGFLPGDHYAALLDTDPAVTGPEYELVFDGGGVKLERSTGSGFAPVQADVRIIWLDGFGPALNVERADIGNPSAIGLVLVSSEGTEGDRAPDSGSWPYSVTPLALSVRSLQLGKAHAGQAFVARAVVWRNDWDIALDDGRITCSAQLGTTRLIGRGSFGGGRVNCRWRLPANASGKLLSGRVGVAYQRATAAQSFSLRVG